LALRFHLTMLGDLKAREGDPAKAQELYEQAADVVDPLLANSPSEQLKSSLIGRHSFWGATQIPVTTDCSSSKRAQRRPASFAGLRLFPLSHQKSRRPRKARGLRYLLIGRLGDAVVGQFEIVAASLSRQMAASN
jgi:hypothetical protein